MFRTALVLLLFATYLAKPSKKNPLKSIMKDLKKINHIAEDVKDIKKDVKDIWEELLYIEGIVTSHLPIKEGNETLHQEQTYNQDTKEAVLKVPAHKDYDDNTFIMVGRNSDHPLAGKMMTVIGNHTCELHDKPAEIDAEDLQTKRGLLRTTRAEAEVSYIVK